MSSDDTSIRFCVSRDCVAYRINDRTPDIKLSYADLLSDRLSRNTNRVLSAQADNNTYSLFTGYSDEEVRRLAEDYVPKTERESFSSALDDLLYDLRRNGYDCEEDGDYVTCTYTGEDFHYYIVFRRP